MTERGITKGKKGKGNKEKQSSEQKKVARKKALVWKDENKIKTLTKSVCIFVTENMKMKIKTFKKIFVYRYIYFIAKEDFLEK